jgi:hypothetical protein
MEKITFLETSVEISIGLMFEHDKCSFGQYYILNHNIKNKKTNTYPSLPYI